MHVATGIPKSTLKLNFRQPKFFIKFFHSVALNKFLMPASVAQLDVHPTGDQEVAGLTPAQSATFFPGD